MNKKGIELSINFLVMLVIAIVVFGFGIRLAYQLSTSASELRDVSVGDLDEQISDLLCGASDRVCTSANRETLERGEVKIIGIKVLNVLDERSFRVSLQEAANVGFTKDNQPIVSSSLTRKPNVPRTLNLKKNEQQGVGFGVEVPNDAVSGTYILDVIVEHDEAGSFASYNPVQKIYIVVP